MLADVASLGREHDERVAVRREDDVRVAVNDLEAGHVGHGTLEAAVFVARDDQGVEPVLSHGRPRVRVAALELCSYVHEASTPLTSVVMVS